MILSKKIFSIAKICYETRRAYLQELGAGRIRPFNRATLKERNRFIAMVKFALKQRRISHKSLHSCMVNIMERDGWKYGEKHNQVLKVSPLVQRPYAAIPIEYKRLYSIMIHIIEVLR